MELNQLRCFLAVANTQSVTKAAEELFITQSALSRIISRLEADLGVRLFDRKGNKIIINERGRLFQSYIAKGVGYIDGGISVVSGEAMRHRGHIVIKSELVADIFGAFCDSLQVSFPEITFAVSHCFDDHSLAEEERSAPDLLISPKRNVSGMVLSGRFSEPWCVIIGKNHALASQKSICLRDVCQQLLVFYGSEADLEFTQNTLCCNGVHPDIIVVENRRRSAALVNRGIGIAFVPYIITEENSLLSHTGLPYNTASVSDANFYQDIYLHRRKGFPRSAEEQGVLDQLLAHLSSAMLPR